jgi:hypothetical protein
MDDEYENRVSGTISQHLESSVRTKYQSWEYDQYQNIKLYIDILKYELIQCHVVRLVSIIDESRANETSTKIEFV